MLRRTFIYMTLACLVGQETAAFADTAHDEGIAAGAAANTVIRSMVNQPSAQSVVPAYTTTPA